MKLDPSLNIMPEGSLDDMPTAVNIEEARERGYQVPEKDHKEPLLRLQLREPLILI